MNEQLHINSLVELFQHNLYTIDEANLITPHEGKKSFLNKINLSQDDFLGKNKKQFVIIVKDAEHKYMSEAHLTFLNKVINACQMTLEDVAIINYHQTTIDIHFLQKQQWAKYLLLFGIDPSTIGITEAITSYQIYNSNGINILLSDSLEHLSNNTPAAKQQKKSLWIALKSMLAL